MEKDPNEINNLANNTTYERIIIELRQIFLAWMKGIDVPLLKGKVKNERQVLQKNYKILYFYY